MEARALRRLTIHVVRRDFLLTEICFTLLNRIASNSYFILTDDRTTLAPEKRNSEDFLQSKITQANVTSSL